MWILDGVALFLSQNPPVDTNSLSGTSGWFGAGLLGLVLSWLLLVHLPRQDARNDAKDKILLERLEAKDRALEAKDKVHTEIVKLITDSSRAQLDAITSHCREELDEITKTFVERTDILLAYFKSKKLE